MAKALTMKSTARKGGTFTLEEVQEAFRFVHRSLTDESSATPQEALCEVEMALGLSDEECDAIHEPPCAKSEGWDVFNGDEIQRDDERNLFESDADALGHIKACRDCQAKLGREALRVGLVKGDA
jgi:hypothetical protein